MEKNCEAAEAVNTVWSFNNKRHLIPYAALISQPRVECVYSATRNECSVSRNI